MNDTKYAELQETGRCCYESIADMVAALECDYDRLEELQSERDNYEGEDEWEDISPELAEELEGLEDEANGCESEDEAREAIEEDPLSVLVRSDWHSPGEENPEPVEFEILLSTGGPATRIVGELGLHAEPSRARLEVQDWGTPWTEYLDSDRDVLLSYARCFYFGE